MSSPRVTNPLEAVSINIPIMIVEEVEWFLDKSRGIRSESRARTEKEVALRRFLSKLLLLRRTDSVERDDGLVEDLVDLSSSVLHKVVSEAGIPHRALSNDREDMKEEEGESLSRRAKDRGSGQR